MGRPPRLADDVAARRVAALPGWTRSQETITRTFKFKGFPDSVAFVDRIVAPAEAMAHHPDLDIRYDKVTVTLSTHDAGGLTEYDFALAAKIDQLEH